MTAPAHRPAAPPPCDAVSGRADLSDVPLRWVLVADAEVGVLHRLARVVRGTPGGVLVRLDHLPAGVRGAQVGISPSACRGGAPAQLVWLGALTAPDVGLVAAWIATGAPEVPAELARCLVAVTGAPAGRSAPPEGAGRDATSPPTVAG